jgi:1-phosphofructokinase
VHTAGEARSALIFLEDNARATVINEEGPELSEHDRRALLAAFSEEVVGHRVAVAIGSMPIGAPVDLYADIVRRARDADALSVVDAAREALAGVLPSRPDVVTPNLGEASALLHGTADEPVEAGSAGDVRAEAIAAARELVARGARSALVTVGRHGTAGADADGAFWISAPEVAEVSPIGAGDSFVAGLARALEAGRSLRDAAGEAVATGSASVATALAGGVEAAFVHELAGSLSWQRA